jgi:hypothetical protein
MVPRWVKWFSQGHFGVVENYFTNAFSPTFFLLESHKKKEFINYRI